MEDPGQPQETRSRLVLTDGGAHPLALSNPRQAIELELSLNKSPYGHAWKHIGDALYDFGVGRPTVAALTLTHFQLVYLKTLLSERDGRA
jgi:hypothetical protein